MSYIIRDGIKAGIKYREKSVTWRVFQADSLREYCEIGLTKCEYSGYERSAKNARKLSETGWKEVLTGLKAAQDRAQGALTPVRKRQYSWAGNAGLSLDRLSQVKPCMVNLVKKQAVQDKFVRIMFLAEAFSGCSSELFVEQIRKLLEACIRLENEGRSFEVLMTFGAFQPGSNDHSGYPRNHGLLDGCLVKAFNQKMDLCALSALGHPDFFCGAHFAAEGAQGAFPTRELPQPPTRAHALALLEPETYLDIFSQFYGEEYAKSLVIVDKHSLMKGAWEELLKLS